MRDPVLDDIKLALADPVDVCGRLGLLEGSQRQAKGLLIRCPSHDDRHASCSVIAGDEGAPHFLVSCKVGGCLKGDCFDLVAAVHHLDRKRDFPRVKELAADLAGIELERRDVHAAPKLVPLRPKVDPAEIWDHLTDPDDDVWGYLRARGIDDEAALEVCRAAGPASPDPAGHLARGGWRLAMALRDSFGRVVAVQLRSIDPAKGGNDRFRSIGPSAGGCFGKIHDMSAASTVVLCEGMVDTITAIAWAKPGTAVIGFAGTEAIQSLRPFDFDGKRVIIATDADEPKKDGKRPGDDCAAAIVKMLLEAGSKARFFRARVPLGKDIAEYAGLGGDLGRLFDEAPVLSSDGTVKPPPPLVIDAAREAWAEALPLPRATGLRALDEGLNGGLFAESMYVLCAPQKRGKTGLTLQFCRSLSSGPGAAPVLYLTSELTRRQALSRIAAQRLRCPWIDLYRLAPAAVDVVERGLDGLRLRVETLGRDTQILDLISRVADVEGEAPILVLDYLQHAARRMRPDDMRLATSHLADEITRWVADTRSSAIVVSAVSRAWTAGNDEGKSGRDFESAAKESGDIEYDAGGTLYLDTDACPLGGTSAARLHIANHRFGGDGKSIGLRFHGAYGLFEPDPSANLTELQQQIVAAIRDGATSAEAVAEAVGKRKAEIVKQLNNLAAADIITRIPLRLN